MSALVWFAIGVALGIAWMVRPGGTWARGYAQGWQDGRDWVFDHPSEQRRCP